MKIKYSLFGLILILSAAKPALSHDVIKEVLESYRDVQLALVEDLYVDAQKASVQLFKDAGHWLDAITATDPRRPYIEKITLGAELITDASSSDVKKIRNGFSVASGGLIAIIRHSTDLQAELQLCYCGMVKEYWVQPKTDTKLMNPYMGKAMPQCGTKKPW